MSRVLASCGRPPMKKSWLQLSNLGDTRCAPCEIVQIGYVRMKNGTSLAFRLQLGNACVPLPPSLSLPPRGSHKQIACLLTRSMPPAHRWDHIEGGRSRYDDAQCTRYCAPSSDPTSTPGTGLPAV